jgi:hypothetical protein
MAEMLKRHYDLSTLKVTLLADADPPSVRFDFELTREQVSETVASWLLSTTELGLPAMLDSADIQGAGYRFRLPEAMAGELAHVVDSMAFPDRPLWLHLAKPYGHLGLVPWEQLLVPVLPVPVLRLPDFIVEPVRSRRAITVVLCADDSPGDVREQAEAIGRLAAAVVGAVPLPTTVHIFTTAPLYELLRHARSPVAQADRVLLHDPAGAAAAARAIGDTADPYDDVYTGAEREPVEASSTDTAVGHRRNVWLTWARDTMCGQSVDVVHFLAGAVLRLEQGALALSENPADPEDTGLSVVSTAALTRFLLQVGAWGCAFTSPVGNPSEMGLRLVATTLADLRPTTLLHHELRLDPGFRALADGYRLMTSREPGTPPTDGSVFLYCQPFQVATEPRKAELLAAPPAAPPVDRVEPTEKVRGLLVDAATTPTWVSASQRYVEQYEWRLHQWSDTEQLPVPPELSSGVTKALELIQGVVDRYAYSAAATYESPPAAVVDIGDSAATDDGGAAGPTEVPR